MLGHSQLKHFESNAHFCVNFLTCFVNCEEMDRGNLVALMEDGISSVLASFFYQCNSEEHLKDPKLQLAILIVPLSKTFHTSSVLPMPFRFVGKYCPASTAHMLGMSLYSG